MQSSLGDPEMAKKRKHSAVGAAGGGGTAEAAAAIGRAGVVHPQKSAKAGSKPGLKQPRMPSHQHTDVAPTGLGQQLSSLPGRLARE